MDANALEANGGAPVSLVFPAGIRGQRLALAPDASGDRASAQLSRSRCAAYARMASRIHRGWTVAARRWVRQSLRHAPVTREDPPAFGPRNGKLYRLTVLASKNCKMHVVWSANLS
jgi:hypothetical protein